MTTEEIAKKLVEYCKVGEYQKCYDELYSPDIISHEPEGFGGGTTKGMEAIYEKGKQWKDGMKELHSSFTDDAIVANNTFACIMGFDATMKDDKRMSVKELAIYRVENGKIVEEWFMM